LAPFDAVSYTLAKKAYKRALAAITSPLTSNLDFGGYKGINVGSPVNPTDLARLDDLRTIKELNKDLMELWHRSLPITFIAGFPLTYSVDGEESSYDGEILHLKTTVTGKNSAYRTTAIHTLNLGVASWTLLLASALLSSPQGNTEDSFPFFYEPANGDFVNYQGFRFQVGTHYCVSNSGGVSTTTAITLDLTTWKKLTLIHWTDRSQCNFYVDDSLIVSHTTNISAQPFEILCAEPGTTIMDWYVKYPPGIHLGHKW